MSKLSELRVLQYGRSVDAPIQYHHRSGDEEGSGANRLDLYAHTDSAEDMALETEDAAAKAQFIKGFWGYMRKVYSRTEREFLKRMMSGRETPQEVGRALGVDWFKYMQNIQRRAYKNIKPLVKLVSLTGWSQGDYFVKMIMKRFSLLEDGAELAELLPKSHADRRKAREEMKAQRLAIAAERKNKYAATVSAWRAAHREELRTKGAAYYATHCEEIKAQTAAYRATHREEIKAYNAAYRAAHREELRAKDATYHAAHREEIKAKKAAYRAAHREEIKAQMATYHAVHREEIKAYKKAYRAAHREELRAKNATYRAAHREKLNDRRKERRRAAKLAAEQGNV
ncbi:MAG: hypothetical protein E7357_03050 [Clostridiales bacterium]|nr:hypothetical protein [Clostridiales bacterium]